MSFRGTAIAVRDSSGHVLCYSDRVLPCLTADDSLLVHGRESFSGNAQTGFCGRPAVLFWTLHDVPEVELAEEQASDVMGLCLCDRDVCLLQAQALGHTVSDAAAYGVHAGVIRRILRANLPEGARFTVPKTP